jgi:hypothetical protein
MVQGVGPEFKPQRQKKKKKSVTAELFLFFGFIRQGLRSLHFRLLSITPVYSGS